MPDGISFKISGLEGLQKKLQELGPRLGGNALRSATNAAMNPVVKRARATIPVGSISHKTYKGNVVYPGFSKRSIKKKTKLSKDKRTAWTAVGVLSEAYYAIQFVERGTSKQPAQPWLVPAFESTKQEVERAFAEKLKIQIDKAVKKL